MFQRTTGNRSSATTQQSPGGSKRVTILNLCFWTTIYYAGFLTGMHSFLATNDKCSRKLSAALGVIEEPVLAVNDPETRELQRIVESVVQKSLAQALEKQGPTPKVEEKKTETQSNQSKPSYSRFPKEMARFATGAARTTKQDFLKIFDYGYPEDQNKGEKGAKEVLLLYAKKDYIPEDVVTGAVEEKGDGIPFFKDPAAATAKCQEMHVVTTDSPCLAIMNGFGSFHIQRWIRPHGDVSSSLMSAGRGVNEHGGDAFRPPEIQFTRSHWELLQRYFKNLDQTIKELKPIVQSISINKTVIIMVCNFGQSELLMNFVCSSRARGFDISNILLFATDKETLELAKSLGMTGYYDERNFGHITKKAAAEYMDEKFADMMYAKIVVVQVINFMGYDLLFQDVDVHWYRNPLLEFHNTSSPLFNFDILLQDDGSRSLRYAPFCANSGFYYVRYNDRTRYLFISLLLQGDLVAAKGSHQQFLISLLADHSSWTGLRVKVLGHDDYPGGWDFHRWGRRNYLRSISDGKFLPQIFHMSWTQNKANKILFMKQMGMWHLKDTCKSQSLHAILSSQVNATASDTYNLCCSSEPLISCHYKDKPAVVNCSSSPPIDRDGSVWWK